MVIYIARPLFNEIELERNRQLKSFLKNLNYDTYLPQEDGDILYNLIQQGVEVAGTRKKIFENDIQEIQKADIVLCILDGGVSDESMYVELGIGYALNKICIGSKGT